MEFEGGAAPVENRDADDVRRQQVAGELNTLELESEDACQGVGQNGLANAWNILDQQMAPRQQASQGKPDLFFLAKDNLVGLISYSNDVHIDLPISKFDLHQRSLFAGAVNDLQAGGNTATFDAIAVAMKMLIDQKAAGSNADPNLKPKIFVLSDGQTNRGHSLDDIGSIVQASGIPIYTIGYNANIPALQEISSINEAACINADTKIVADEIRKLFDAEM